VPPLPRELRQAPEKRLIIKLPKISNKRQKTKIRITKQFNNRQSKRKHKMDELKNLIAPGTQCKIQLQMYTRFSY
jgi:hypothetical protein